MAEFKLGRIRFVWKNQWSSGTVYYQDDVIAFGGKTYICVIGHTSQDDFFSDLDIVPPKWNLVSEGQTWKGEWSTETDYVYQDIVSYGARLYICNTIHTSSASVIDASDGLEADLAKWDVFAEGLDWKGEWNTDTRYRINDVVKYGGTTYVCNTLHVSAATDTLGLEADQAKWDYFNQGIDYKGDWTGSTRYKINDLVRYGAGVWIATANHTSTTSFGVDADNWEKFVEGFQFEDEWSHTRRYQPGDVVRYGGNQYLAKLDHIDVSPAESVRTITNITNADPAVVTVLQHNLNNGREITLTDVEGMTAVNGETFYAKVVDADTIQLYTDAALTTTFNSTAIAVYTAGGETNASIPPQWELFSQGLRFIGDWNGDSTGALYKTGDVVRQGGYTYRAIKDHTNKQPPSDEYWEKLNSGFEWRGEWQDDQEYFIGDVVRYGSNSYICTQGHISEGDDYSSESSGSEGSRPDLADSGQFWSVIAIGSEQSVLTTPGDLLYFTGSVPTRLPIGLEGQVLRVDENNLPSWEFLQSVEDVYYVSEEGQDRPYPEYGSNIDRPFRSIRFACEQIEKGAKNPNAQFLLESNRSFVQREVTAYIRDLVENATPGSIWEGFTYDTVKCERDVGFVIDRIKYDLGHGGNLKTRAAAQSLLGALGDGPFSIASEQEGSGYYPGLVEEREQSLVAYNYMLTLLGNILDNEAPEVIYQNVTDDSTAIIEQYININLEAETVAFSRVTTLANIIINAIDSQDANSIPDREIAHSLVKVSTGYFYEVLPIIVPAYTAVMGDELRSTHVIAATPTTPKSDVPYSIASFDRISEVVSDVVVGTEVTTTTGNTKVQDTSWPLAISDQSTTVESLVNLMKYKIDYDVDAMISTSLSDPASFVGTDKNIARENIIANRDFIIAEVIAYIDDQYDTLKYSKTDIRTKSRYILDALEYDLTYGGNSLSVITGLAYYDGDDDTIPVLPASIKTEIIAAYNYLKTTAQNVAGNTTIVSPYQTAVSQTLTGNVGSIAEIANLVEDIIDIIDNGPDAVGDTTTLTNVTLTNYDNTTTALITAFNTLDSATSTIQSNTIDWIDTNHPSLSYNSAKCSRDIGKILEAVSYDFALNTEFRTLKAAHAYLRETATEVYTLNQKAVTRSAIQYALLDETDGAIANVNDDTIAIASIRKSAKIIDAVIFGATNEGSVCQSEDQNVYYAIQQLERNRDFIVEEVRAWVNYNYVNFNDYYNQATCSRDVGYIIDAVSYDLITGSNFSSSIAGSAYYRAVTSAENLVNNQLIQTLAAFKETRRLIVDIIPAALKQTVAGSFNNILNILENGLGVVPTYTFPDNGTTVADDSTTAGTFQTNRATIISDVSSYYQTNHSALWTAKTAQEQADWEDNIGYIIDAITFDTLYGGNYQSVIAGESYYSYSVLQLTSGEQTAEIDTLTNSLKVELVADAEAASQAGVGADIDDVIAVLTSGAETVTTVYPSATGESAAIQTAFSNSQDAKVDVQGAIITYITNTFSSYTYEEDLCLRDVNRYVDALKYDLKEPGNYKSRYAARYYSNAVIGSHEEDMFYCRDATGVRNCTLNGLNGDLLPANEFGTSRTTAGAYCSLDPGFGPDDFSTWIITRSPYIQGVTTFGNAAIGQKIDGALHNGGNDSITSNDFTQVISDGIGAYITNNGRAELVSVFTYYAHIGYLAEAGGRIRATNGNNSYGTFGSVAEGVDPDETPVTAIVDNITQYNATISEALTDNDKFLQLEFNHAGNNYTEVTYSTFGAGTDADFIGDEFRDDGINFVQIAQDQDPDIPIGGSGYVTVSNTAQTGSLTSVTLAATDGALSSAYPGMKVYIAGGAGVGQYGLVDSYNAGSKVANVIRESDGQPGWNHIIEGTAIVAPNASSTYQIEPHISFSAPTHSDTSISGLPSSTWYDIAFIETSAEYTDIDAGGQNSSTSGNGTGATFDIVRNGSKYYVTLNSAGTSYARLDTITLNGSLFGGTTSVNDIVITVTSINSVTGAVVDFDFAGFSRGGFFYAIGAGSQAALSFNGSTWVSQTLPSIASGNWSSITTGLQDDGSSTFQPCAAVVVADGVSDIAYATPTNSVSWSSTTLPGAFNATGENSIAFGKVIGTTSNRFVVIGDADTDIVYSDNGGATWTLESSALPATGFDEITYGKGRWVAINSSSTSAAYSDDGITWVGVTAPATFAAATDIVWGNNKFVALGGTNGIMYSFDGTEWFENSLSLPLTATERKIAYGQGMFVITSDNADGILQYSEDGIYWQEHNIGSVGFTSGTDAIAFGNANREGEFRVLGPTVGSSSVKLGARARGRASIASEQLFEVRITEPGSGYTSEPTITVVDPNNIDDVVLQPQIGKGVLAQPTFYNRGAGYTTASAEIDSLNSNGNAEFPQSGSFIAVRRLSRRPVPGSNVEFDSLPGEFYKLVNTISFVGSNDGSYTGFLQISPNISVEDVPPNDDPVELRIRFSQVRLTGHDFLDIGTGGFTSTNYPNTPLIQPDQNKETQDSDGGRVFYTATDQDGNFRVGDLFTIEQSTGVATLNADAFNIAGLQELSLGEVTLGGNSATVNEFSTDPFFTANSDNVIPTQRAVKAYIESQIGGGGATLNVNSVTAGDIFVGTDTITTLSGNQLNIKANVVFSGSILGLPLAYNYFLR